MNDTISFYVQIVKANLVRLKREPDYEIAFERRERRNFVDCAGNVFSAWVAQPTDIIIGKLIAWNEGRSDKHLKAIRAMLVFDLSGSSDLAIYYERIAQEARRLGKETLDMWNQVLSKAKDDVAEHKK